jgi:hypothetical protein
VGTRKQAKEEEVWCEKRREMMHAVLLLPCRAAAVLLLLLLHGAALTRCVCAALISTYTHLP